MRPPKRNGVRLLSVRQDAKTVRGEHHGYLTGILFLAPHEEASEAMGRPVNLCGSASAGCIASCIFRTGRADTDRGGGWARQARVIRDARVRKTVYYLTDRAGFLADLRSDVRAVQERAVQLGLQPAIRLNGTSDLPGLALQLAAEFPTVQFYDYTAHAKAWARQMGNYHLTWSYKGDRDPWDVVPDVLAHGINVAVPFRVCDHGPATSCHCPLPTTYRGLPVFDGDQSDLRFLDPRPVLVGLRVKGTGGKTTGVASGFAIDVRKGGEHGSARACAS